MKRILLVISLILSLFIYGCTSYEYGSKDLSASKIEFVFINAGEEYELDIEKQFELTAITISKYELTSVDDEIAKIKGGKIIGDSTGKTDIYATLYEKTTKEKYYQKVATVYVVDVENMIEVKTPEDLANMNNNKSGYYVLKSDIDLSNIDSWNPIGNFGVDNQFTGIFVNPDGFKIKNLSIPSCDTTNRAAGLFGSIGNAYIDGLILENVSIDVSDVISDTSYAGGITSNIHYGVIRNCQVFGNLQSQNGCGGITGINSVGYIFDCYFEGEVQSYGLESGAGGIAGISQTNNSSGGAITNCKAKATVRSSYSAGGIVGINYEDENIFNCTFTGEVIGDSYQNDYIGKTK